MVNFLLGKGADLPSVSSDGGRSVLDYALDDGQLETVRYLISGCELPLSNFLDSQGRFHLHGAVAAYPQKEKIHPLPVRRRRHTSGF